MISGENMALKTTCCAVTHVEAGLYLLPKRHIVTLITDILIVKVCDLMGMSLIKLTVMCGINDLNFHDPRSAITTHHINATCIKRIRKCGTHSRCQAQLIFAWNVRLHKCAGVGSICSDIPT